MAAFYKLIAGLGNPTRAYEVTRHNSGFWFLDKLSELNGVQIRDETKVDGRIGVWMWGGEPIYLIQPMSYMNNSGKPIRKLADYYKIPIEKILVVHDELNFDPGIIKFKIGGGHGGHNGLRDIIATLGGAGFGRIRIGIGHPMDKKKVMQYVLESASKEDCRKIEDALDNLVKLMPSVLDRGLQNAMNSWHLKNKT